MNEINQFLSLSPPTIITRFMPKFTTGYCTNVHAGANFAEMKANLAAHAVEVRQILGADVVGLGLWLSADAAESLVDDEELLTSFAAWLADSGLVPFTLNGFPYGNFHQKVVKHEVYKPTWADPARESYTANLIQILHRLLPAGEVGSISTLPLGWPPMAEADLATAAEALSRTAGRLAELEKETGRRIVICIEPEPGCAFSTSQDLIDYFEKWLFVGDAKVVAANRRYLGVCHDICHASVMFEPQADVLSRYKQAGICVGKVQVSSAIRLELANQQEETQQARLAELQRFTEDRYLHQTMWRTADGQTHFLDDLPKALAAMEGKEKEIDDVRVHFHVPIFLGKAGNLGTSQADILQVLAQANACETGHFEVETYAWNVLPESLRPTSLAEGIAQEIAWLSEQLDARQE
jgi:hypothetical protein